jgi:hypothetical protein
MSTEIDEFFHDDVQIPADVESLMRLSEFAADIAYSRRTMYEAYLAEGFDHNQALELCKL